MSVLAVTVIAVTAPAAALLLLSLHSVTIPATGKTFTRHLPLPPSLLLLALLLMIRLLLMILLLLLLAAAADPAAGCCVPCSLLELPKPLPSVLLVAQHKGLHTHEKGSRKGRSGEWADKRKGCVITTTVQLRVCYRAIERERPGLDPPCFPFLPFSSFQAYDAGSGGCCFRPFESLPKLSPHIEMCVSKNPPPACGTHL